MLDLSNPKIINEILQQHHFSFNKTLGQNFLINPEICPRMVSFCEISHKTGVLEIGPGIGVLTKELAEKAPKVVAVEIDKKLLPLLDETLKDYNNIKIINSDILKLDINKLISEEFEGLDVIVCANLPYYITSQVIMKLLESKAQVKSITAMVQKEFAQRLCTPIGTRESGAITASVNYYSKPTCLFNVSKGSFMPAPNVDSAVIQLEILKEPPVKVSDEKLFFKVIKSAFAQRRKTILNSISSGMGIDKAKILQILESFDIDSRLRAEVLSLQAFAEISNTINNTIFGCNEQNSAV